ncbi:MAG: tetratricopeptide repeat protein [Desulfobacterales bacterium]
MQKKWSEKPLKFLETQDNKQKSSNILNYIGIIARQQAEILFGAEKWFQKCLEIEIKQGNENKLKYIYGDLGMIAEKQGNFIDAEKWFQNRFEIEEKDDDEHGAQLPANGLQNFSEAERRCWY